MADKNTKVSPQEGTQTADKTEKVKLYNVILINDEFTHMEFVIGVLMEVFNHNLLNANVLTMDIHNNGSAVAGTYEKQVAEKKLALVLKLSAESQHPLRCIIKESL